MVGVTSRSEKCHPTEAKEGGKSGAEENDSNTKDQIGSIFAVSSNFFKRESSSFTRSKMERPSTC